MAYFGDSPGQAFGFYEAQKANRERALQNAFQMMQTRNQYAAQNELANRQLQYNIGRATQADVLAGRQLQAGIDEAAASRRFQNQYTGPEIVARTRQYNALADQAAKAPNPKLSALQEQDYRDAQHDADLGLFLSPDQITARYKNLAPGRTEALWARNQDIQQIGESNHLQSKQAASLINSYWDLNSQIKQRAAELGLAKDSSGNPLPGTVPRLGGIYGFRHENPDYIVKRRGYEAMLADKQQLERIVKGPLENPRAYNIIFGEGGEAFSTVPAPYHMRAMQTNSPSAGADRSFPYTGEMYALPAGDGMPMNLSSSRVPNYQFPVGMPPQSYPPMGTNRAMPLSPVYSGIVMPGGTNAPRFNPALVNSQADYDALAPGAAYLDSQGNIWRKR